MTHLPARNSSFREGGGVADVPQPFAPTINIDLEMINEYSTDRKAVL